MKRLVVHYKGDKYLGDSSSSIANRIASDCNIPLEEAMKYVASHVKDNKNIIQSALEVFKKKTGKAKSFSDYINGAKALVNVIEGNTVTQEEINRRASICNNCPMKTQIPGCMGCGLAGRISNFINSIKKAFKSSFVIPNNLETKGCGVCNCALSVMLPSKMNAFSESDQQERPNHCWVKKTSPNYQDL